MNETQILMAALASAPSTLVVLIGILMNNSRMNDMNARLAEGLAQVNGRLAELRSDMNTRFDQVDRRFDDLKELWRSELHRVEEILDARLKHLEDR
jgi:hypothetical protein